MTEPTDIHALVGAYALDAVDDVERAAFDRHLRHCDVCGSEVAELRETTAVLASAVAAAPPAGLRDSVLAAVARTPQQRPGRTDRAPHTDAAALSRWRRWTAAAVAAGVIAIGSGFATWSVADQRVRDAQAQSAESRRIADVLSAPDATVSTKDVAGGGRITVVRARAHNRAVVVLAGFPAPPPDEAYQLWKAVGDAPMTSLDVLPAGHGQATRLVDNMGDADTFGVSLEPAAGSPTPTKVIDTLQLT